MNSINNKFTWGDSIVLSKEAPNQFHPEEFGSICGFYKIKYDETAKELVCSKGDWIYTVEFEDGSDIHVAECFLEKYQETQSCIFLINKLDPLAKAQILLEGLP